MGKLFKSTMAIFLLLVFALSIVSSANATKAMKIDKPEEFNILGKAKIKGKITEGIKITLLDGDKEIAQVLSNEKGWYEMTGIKTGKYTIKAEYTGFEDISKNVNIKNRKNPKVRKNMNLEVVVEDTTAPVVVLDNHVEATNTNIITFTGTVDDETARVFVNGQEAEVIDNTWTIELDLPEGENTITITAVDQTRNEATPIVSNILIDTTAPDTFIDNVIIDGTTVDTEFHGTESVYSVKIDDGEWSDWQDGHFFTFENIEYGEHTLYVRSMDDVGNIDTEPATYMFTIEEPEATIAVIHDELDAFMNSGNFIMFNIGYLTVSKTYDEYMEIRPMIKFDTSSIPVDADIRSAKLVLTHFLYNAGNIATIDDWTYYVKRVNEDWDETLTWNDGGNSLAWTLNPTTDDEICAVISGTIYDDPVVEADITDLVKSWVSGDTENYGIQIEVDERPYSEDAEIRRVNNVLIGNGPNSPDINAVPKIVVEYY